MKKLTPNQRETVRMKLKGLCAYCGNPLGGLWHVDHRLAVRRDLSDELAGKSKVTRGEDDLSNMLPACTRCNQRKGSLTVEEFRGEIRLAAKRAVAECSHVRLALDFKLLRAAKVPRVKFHFEEVWDV